MYKKMVLTGICGNLQAQLSDRFQIAHYYYVNSLWISVELWEYNILMKTPLISQLILL